MKKKRRKVKKDSSFPALRRISRALGSAPALLGG